ncbi:MAG: hypothetical protein V4511_04735 [Bacteroidota bacterium]
MGLFDIFKKKETESVQQTTPQKEPYLGDLIKKKETESVQQTTLQKEPYFGDLNKTKEIYNLVKVPPSDRDENWKIEFLSNLSSASFRCGDPQVIKGPDGFPYFQLFLPEPNKSFQCYVIDRMQNDFLLESGFGVVIIQTGKQPDWVLSYGDILNLHLNKTFYTIGKTAFSREMKDEVIQKEEEIMIGQPSETILPKATRKLLDSFLKMNGIKSPKVLLLMRHINGGEGVSQDIAFNILPENFSSEAIYRSVMQTIAWYLPRHYSFVGVDEKTFGSGFMPL